MLLTQSFNLTAHLSHEICVIGRQFHLFEMNLHFGDVSRFNLYSLRFSTTRKSPISHSSDGYYGMQNNEVVI